MTDQRTNLFRLHKPAVGQLEELVGGEIEIIYIDHETQLVINDMAELDGAPVNFRATKIYRKVHKDGKVHGHAVILEGKAS